MHRSIATIDSPEFINQLLNPLMSKEIGFLLEKIAIVVTYLSSTKWQNFAWTPIVGLL